MMPQVFTGMVPAAVFAGGSCLSTFVSVAALRVKIGQLAAMTRMSCSR